MLSEKPIGVFDSGLGGLTVLKELRRIMPTENFVYLGDVARLPYGTKSRTVVEKYALRCAQFLLEKGVKWVVIACNTATAMAADLLVSELPVGVSGVIAPGVRAALAASRSGQVVVMATPSTVQSGAYPGQFFAEAGARVRVEQVACPLLVPLAEEGWFEGAITESVISRYLEKISLDEFDVCLLGCTHYPLLEKSIRAVVAPHVQLVHGGLSLAQDLMRRLQENQLRSVRSDEGRLRLFATDKVSDSLPMLSALFGRQIAFEAVDL